MEDDSKVLYLGDSVCRLRGRKTLPWPSLCLDCLRIEAGELIRSLCNAGFILQASLSMQARHAILASSITVFSYSILLVFLHLMG